MDATDQARKQSSCSLMLDSSSAPQAFQETVIDSVLIQAMWEGEDLTKETDRPTNPSGKKKKREWHSLFSSFLGVDS